jgi:hypothetical protein
MIIITIIVDWCKTLRTREGQKPCGLNFAFSASLPQSNRFPLIHVRFPSAFSHLCRSPPVNSLVKKHASIAFNTI